MLNLDTLSVTDSDMPVSKRGRTATPIPAVLVKAVGDSYTMADGLGKTITIPADESGVKTLKGLIRRAADALGYGVSISDGKVTKTSHEVKFRAKDKNKRDPKPNDIFVIDGEDDLVWVEASEEGARLATVTEARALGFVYSGDEWVAPDIDTEAGGQ